MMQFQSIYRISRAKLKVRHSVIASNIEIHKAGIGRRYFWGSSILTTLDRWSFMKIVLLAKSAINTKTDMDNLEHL